MIFSFYLILFLYSCDIGPEHDVQGEGKKISHEKNLNKLRDLTYDHKGKMPSLIGKSNVEFDNDAFLISFKRQSKSLLQPCLELWRPSPYSVLLRGILSRSGKILEVESMQNDRKLPDCAVEHILGMNFVSLVKTEEFETVAIQWQIEW